MNDLELAKASQACYAGQASDWDRIWQIDGVWMGYRAPILAFRGSATPEDWLRDLRAVPSYQADIGFVECGFMAGMRKALVAWQSNFLDTPVWITGHSLGGAHAAIMAALLTFLDGVLPLGLAVFGCPRPGFYKLRRMLRTGGFPIRAYWNQGDPVPEVPPAVWKVFPYRPIAKPIKLHAGGAPGDHSPLAAHRIARYVAALSPTGA